MSKKLEPFPKFKNDEEREAFLDSQMVERDGINALDLREYDLSRFERLSEFSEFSFKDKTISLRLPESLLERVSEKSTQKKMPRQRYIRLALEEKLARDEMDAA